MGRQMPRPYMASCFLRCMPPPGSPDRPPPTLGLPSFRMVSLGAIDLLAANEVAGGVGKVDEAGLSVKSRARGFMRFSMGIICSSGTLAMSMPRMMPGRPLPYTRNSSCSGSRAGTRRGTKSDRQTDRQKHTRAHDHRPADAPPAVSGWGSTGIWRITWTDTKPVRPREQCPGGGFLWTPGVGNGAKVASRRVFSKCPLLSSEISDPIGWNDPF